MISLAFIVPATTHYSDRIVLADWPVVPRKDESVSLYDPHFPQANDGMFTVFYVDEVSYMPQTQHVTVPELAVVVVPGCVVRVRLRRGRV